jgi:1-acyl-sn-glycerol-3-phosphate acyltransferase
LIFFSKLAISIESKGVLVLTKLLYLAMKLIIGVFSLIWKFYIATIFAFFAILLYPFFFLVLFRPQWKKFSFYLFIFWSWMMRIFCFYHVKTIENNELPDGPYVIIANHTSYLDIFFMYSILPKHPFVFLGKSEILNYPIISTYFKNLNIPVYRGDKSKAGRSYTLASKAVAEGWSLVIFPEGGIPDHQCPKMVPFKDGAFKLAKALNVPIVPLTFTNNYKLFSDPSEILGPARPGVARLYINKPISIMQIQEMEVNELRNLSFDLVNAPILKEHPHLKD